VPRGVTAALVGLVPLGPTRHLSWPPNAGGSFPSVESSHEAHLTDASQLADIEGGVSRDVVTAEIRVEQSLQTVRYGPAAIYGGTVTALLIISLDWRGVLDSYAVIPLGALFLMQLPMLRSYLGLRNRPRPERVSRRHIRRIEGYAALQGVVWATAVVLAYTEFSQVDALVVSAAIFVWAYSSAAAYSTMPMTSSVFVVPMVVATFVSLGVHGFVEWVPLFVLFLGTAGGLVFLIVKNWHATEAAVRLGETVKQQSETMAKVSGQLAKYISPELYQKIFSGEQRMEVAATRKKLTVFFSDVVSFTDITEQLESEELTALLNHYLTEMAVIAGDHGATVDKFIGDAIVVYFGDPDTLGVKEDADACVRMAIAMQRRVREMGSEWRERGVERPFEIRIGINTGYCTVGNFGSQNRMDYTIIGSEVNLASRLESSADVGGILLSNATHSLVKDWVMAEEAAAITVKGFARPIDTYRIKGIYDELEAEGRLIHHDDAGFRLTIDHVDMSDADRVEAVRKLEEAVDELKG